MTPDRKLHVMEKRWWDRSSLIRQVARHLLKFYEILDLSADVLPRLEFVDLNLIIKDWAPKRVHIESHYKHGVLSVDMRQVVANY